MALQKFNVVFLFSAVMVSAAVAQEPDDSLASPAPRYAFDEVLVTAKRLPSTPALSSSPVTVLSARNIESVPAASLANLLSSISGLYIKDYGSSSGLKTLAQRGLGPEHTLVLLNGMRVSGMQNNLVDLGLISADEISGLEVFHGGHSAAFGPDAVAGVVNIRTMPERDLQGITTTTSLGSFGYSRLGVAGGVRLPAGGVRVSFSEERARDDFPFVFRTGPQTVPLTRTNADYSSRAARLHSSVALSQMLHLSVYGRTFGAERGVAGPVVSRHTTSVARQQDTDHLFQIQLAGHFSEPVEFRIGAQFHQSYQRYVDSRFFVGASYIDNYFKNMDIRIEPVAELHLADESRVAVGGEIATVSASGNSLLRSIRRNSLGGFVAADHAVIAGGGLVERLFIQPAFRYDVASTEGISLSHFSPQIGITALIAGPSIVRPVLRASVGRNFRVPTFNELFYAGGGGIGNPQLKPERALSSDVGGELGLALYGLHILRATYFDIAMQNRIVWVAAGGASVTPKNIRDVRSRGLELHYGWHSPDTRYSLSASYTFSTTRKLSADFVGDPNINTQLIYVPQEMASLVLSAEEPVEFSFLREIGGTLLAQYVGFRYTTEDNTGFLPSYFVVNGSVRARMVLSGFRFLLKCDILNILDEAYQTIIAYPMPGRSFKVSFTIDY